MQGRTLDEALAYLEICKDCSKYRNTVCLKDEKDREEKFLNRLAVGFCREKWDRRAHEARAFHFFSTGELADDSYSLMRQIPTDFDAILGVARSGLIPATILSMQLHLPLLSVGKKYVAQTGSGWRLPDSNIITKRLLLVDDTLYSGRSLAKVKEAVKTSFPSAKIETAAIYVHPKSIDKVDYFVEMLPGRHYLEWNFFNSVAISRSIYDFDGILCEDIPSTEDDDGPRYLKALENAVPKYLVRREPIPIIVTARLEKYREVTLAWMQKHGVQCDKLIMGPWNTNAERSKRMEISKFKAGVYKSFPHTIFVESDPNQAREIAELTDKEVLCPMLRRVLVK